MKLISAQITNFKNIYDSQEFKIDQTTCLVGKNEAGKTAILQSLTKLNPIDTSQGNFNELEFPRMSFYEYSNENRPEQVLMTEWELSDSDCSLIEEKIGKGNLSSKIVKLAKGYKNSLDWSVEIHLEKIVRSFILNAGLTADEQVSYKQINTTSSLIKELTKKTDKSDREVTLLQDLKNAFPNGNATAEANAILNKLLPYFIYFPQYDLMRGEVSLTKLAEDKAQNKLTMGDRIFISLLEMAGTTIEEIQSINKFEPLITKLEAVSNRISREIFSYWSQNKHLKVEFRFDNARSEDPPPFNTGYVFRTRINNTRHGVTVSFDERSTGFVWFFSFLVWFSQVKKNFGNNLIILLDEPGLSLHAKAQADLLRYFEEKLTPIYQVIYSTHSPFMIDPNNLLGVRTVEDTMRGEEVLGTKVTGEVLTTDKDTLFPLQAALGYDIAQTLFVGENVLLVEGPSDILFLKWASNELKVRKKAFLDDRWVITPAGSIDKIASFVALFSGKGIHIAALTDYGKGDKNKVQRIKDLEILKSGHVLTMDVYAGQPEADVEDVLGRKLYVQLINKCYGLKSGSEVPEDKPTSSEIRVVKEIEQIFASMQPGAPSFDHYHPAVYLIENSRSLFSAGPDLEMALDKFEKIFIDANALLAK